MLPGGGSSLREGDHRDEAHIQASKRRLQTPRVYIYSESEWLVCEEDALLHHHCHSDGGGLTAARLHHFVCLEVSCVSIDLRNPIGDLVEHLDGNTARKRLLSIQNRNHVVHHARELAALLEEHEGRRQLLLFKLEGERMSH